VTRTLPLRAPARRRRGALAASPTVSPPPLTRPLRVACAVTHSGNVPLEEIYRIARVMRPRSLAKKFSGTVLEMLGTAQSVGCTVEGEDPHDIIDQIHEGEIVCPEE
jgi:hypothetical protein